MRGGSMILGKPVYKVIREPRIGDNLFNSLNGAFGYIKYQMSSDAKNAGVKYIIEKIYKEFPNDQA